MCLENTEVLVEGSSPDHVGWLNAGGRIVVRGDAGDTAAHCAAAGVVYIGGRAGTRTGSLMKHDPMYEPPELWVLKNVGSFSFEFMGGGKAVVCGCDCADLPSVLGERPCVGMVGGEVYVHGPVGGLPADVRVAALEADDQAWLAQGLKDFLAAVGRPELLDGLRNWAQWQKIVPLSFDVRSHLADKPSLSDFAPENGLRRASSAMWLRTTLRSTAWWPTAITASACLSGRTPTTRPPANSIARPPSPRSGGSTCCARAGWTKPTVWCWTIRSFPLLGLRHVRPNPCMQDCTRGLLDSPVQIGKLGSCSADIRVPKPAKRTGKHVGVIGGGWAASQQPGQLARMGHDVTVYEADSAAGGKLEQVIPAPV